MNLYSLIIHFVEICYHITLSSCVSGFYMPLKVLVSHSKRLCSEVIHLHWLCEMSRIRIFLHKLCEAF